MRALLIILLHGYRWVLSPLKVGLFGPGARCRYDPSCSDYALQAVRSHGAVRGVGLAIGRLARCHPWGGFGHDPVPPVSFPVLSGTGGGPSAAGCACAGHVGAHADGVGGGSRRARTPVSAQPA